MLHHNNHCVHIIIINVKTFLRQVVIFAICFWHGLSLTEPRSFRKVTMETEAPTDAKGAHRRVVQTNKC